MTPPLKLTDNIEGMDFQTHDGQSSLHTVTGEVVSLTDEE